MIEKFFILLNTLLFTVNFGIAIHYKQFNLNSFAAGFVLAIAIALVLIVN